MKTRPRILIIGLLVFSLFLTSCIEIHQKIFVKKDGSGTAQLEFIIHKELAAMGLTELKRELKKDAPKGWTLQSEKEVGSNYILTYQTTFKNVSALNDDEIQYSFLSDNKGLFKINYRVKINFLKSRPEPIPFYVFLEVPGTIANTNGTKVSANQIKWEFNGLTRGTELFVESYSTRIGVVIAIIIVGCLIVALFLFIILRRKRQILPQIQGTSKNAFCTQCGASNSLDSKFCEDCGHEL